MKIKIKIAKHYSHIIGREKEEDFDLSFKTDVKYANDYVYDAFYEYRNHEDERTEVEIEDLIKDINNGFVNDTYINFGDFDLIVDII